MTSPSATLYCLPPVLTMAYIAGSTPVTTCPADVSSALEGMLTQRPTSRWAVVQITAPPGVWAKRPPPAGRQAPDGGPAGRLAARRRRLGAGAGSTPLTLGSGGADWAATASAGAGSTSSAGS